MRAPAALLAVALAATLAIPSAPAAATDRDAEVSLSLSSELRLSNATVFAGAFAYGAPSANNPFFVEASSIQLPRGTLTVCERYRGTTALVPRVLEQLDRKCTNEVTAENPLVRFGERTEVALIGDFEVTRFPAASLSTLVPASGETLWAAAISADGVELTTEGQVATDGLQSEGHNFVFYVGGPAVRTIVVEQDRERYFNGTSWAFYWRGDGPLSVRAAGVHLTTREETLAVALDEAERADFRSALHPRTLLDLEEAVKGTDGREPVRNLSALVGSFSRVSSLLNGAVLGYLNGTVDGVALSPSSVTFVRATELRGTIVNGTLDATADAKFTATTAGFASVGKEPTKPPKLLPTLLWAAALFLLAVVPASRRSRPKVARLVGLACALALVVLFDAVIVQRTLDVSVTSLLGAGEPAGSIAALAVFEGFALLLGYFAFWLPVKLGARVVAEKFAPRWTPLAPLLGAGTLLVVALASPFRLLALANLIARL